MLADWLVTLSPYISEVVFHPKLLPWFVSDVQPHDFTLTLSSLLDPSFFPETSGASAEDKAALKAMVERWQRYVDMGKFRLSVPLDLKMGAPGGELADCESTRTERDQLWELIQLSVRQSGPHRIHSATCRRKLLSCSPSCKNPLSSFSRAI